MIDQEELVRKILERADSGSDINVVAYTLLRIAFALERIASHVEELVVK